jgi:hypothetical protein
MRKSLRMMPKSLWLTGAALLAVAATSSIALAAVNVKSLPTATFSGASVTVTGGNFSGLGSTPAIANLTATGSASYTCTNPQGHASPGQNPVPAKSGSSEPFNLGNSEHNGRGTISSITASVTAPPTPSAKEAGCGGTGSTQWQVTLDSLTAKAAHLAITEGTTLVFCRDYASDGPATGIACP